MKKILFIGLFLLSTTLLVAQVRYATVQGRYISEVEKNVSLWEVVDGDLIEYASTKLGEGGSFAFTLIPGNTQFYYLGTKENNFRVYLQGGEMLNVEIDAEKNEIALIGKVSKENQLVHAWRELISDIEIMAVKPAGVRKVYTDFYPVLTQKVGEYEKFRSRINLKNKAFNENMLYLVDSDIRFYALEFLASGRLKHPEQGNITDFHKKILSEKLIVSRVLVLPYAWRYVHDIASITRIHIENSENENLIDYVLKRMDTPILKSMYVLQQLKRKRRAEQYNNFMKMYGKYLTLPEHKNIAANLGKDFKSILPGKDAIDFAYPDVDGKIHSLSDYIGKVVVVDIWATWCGPCMKELPFFRKLEREFVGKDVVFIGVSMDRHQSKWAEYVKKENLEGVQLFGDNTIRENYKVDGIPRFMIFNRQGKIITTDAPRPSTPLLKTMIEDVLKMN